MFALAISLYTLYCFPTVPLFEPISWCVPVHLARLSLFLSPDPANFPVATKIKTFSVDYSDPQSSLMRLFVLLNDTGHRKCIQCHV